MVAADPYPWPYDGPVDPARLALVVAGAQLAWERRSLASEETTGILRTVAEVIRRAGGLVVHLRHGSGVARPSGLPPLRGDPEWSLVTDPDPSDLVVDAAGIDGFCGGPLDQELRSRRIDTLVLAGYGLEAPVSSTLRSANDRGYECLTLRNGAAPLGAATGRRALDSITMSGGIFGAVASGDALVAALLPLFEHTTAEALR
jgi:nicotinamidase-related amidase